MTWPLRGRGLWRGRFVAAGFGAAAPRPLRGRAGMIGIILHYISWHFLVQVVFFLILLVLLLLLSVSSLFVILGTFCCLFVFML
jgi:membrane protein implicated in regulation of membrane protease activity